MAVRRRAKPTSIFALGRRLAGVPSVSKRTRKRVAKGRVVRRNPGFSVGDKVAVKGECWIGRERPPKGRVVESGAGNTTVELDRTHQRVTFETRALRLVPSVKKKNPRKRNPQKTFRAKGKVVSFWAKKNPGRYRVVKFSGPSDVGGKVLSCHSTLAAAQKAHKDIVMPGKDLIPGYLNYGITESTTKTNPRRTKRRKNPTFRTRSGKTISFRAKTDKKKNPRRRKNPAAKRSARTGRFVKLKANRRKRK